MHYELTPAKKYNNKQKENKMKTADKKLAKILNEKPAPKAPRVIKVSTVLTTISITLAIIGAFVGGWVASNSYNSMIEEHTNTKASELIKKLQ